MELKNLNGCAKEPAVVVRNGVKSFGRNEPVLNNLNMTVPSGEIYGLLGASGCGKTTLLSCILGFKRLDNGSIQIFGDAPSLGEHDIGYQPQEVALYNFLSVADTLHYFGRLLCMTRDDISERTKYLLKSLELPETSQLISSLSGGQQRRISLAIALLKIPKLLVLDEPTAGQDPLLVESIWAFLQNLLKQTKLTIIITTHYYDEVKSAQTVGFLRNGRLLVEENPEQLLAKYETIFLDDVFRKLCHDEESGLMTFKGILSLKPAVKPNEKPKSSRGFTPKNHLLIIWALIVKNLLFLKRTPIFTVHIVLLPCIQILNFIFILGLNPKGIQLGVVQQGERALCSDFVNNSEDSCFSEDISCKFLAKFSKDEFNLLEYSSNEEALEGVQRGDILGFLSFPANYSRHMSDRALLKQFAENETIEGSLIRGRFDITSPIKSEFVQSKIHQYFQIFLSDFAVSCNQSRELAEPPLKYNAVYGSLNSNLQPYLQPGFFALTIILLPMACAVRMLQDRKLGTLQRSQVIGLSYSHILLELFISDGIMLMIQVSLCYLILVGIGGYNQIGISYLLLIFLLGAVGLTIGFLVGQAFDQELEAIYIILGIYMPLTVASGANTPFEGMSSWAQFIYQCSPVALPIKSLRSMVTRNWDILHPKVWPGFATTLIYISIIVLLSLIVIRVRSGK